MSVHVITSMTRTRFKELVAETLNGNLEKHWGEGKRAVTKAEKVESRQIRALGQFISEMPETFKELRESDDWRELRFLQTDCGIGVSILLKSSSQKMSDDSGDVTEAEERVFEI